MVYMRYRDWQGPHPGPMVFFFSSHMPQGIPFLLAAGTSTLLANTSLWPWENLSDFTWSVVPAFWYVNLLLFVTRHTSVGPGRSAASLVAPTGEVGRLSRPCPVIGSIQCFVSQIDVFQDSHSCHKHSRHSLWEMDFTQ